MELMLHTIATFRSPFPSKFGIPRQSGMVTDLLGRIVLEPAFRNPDYLRGIEGFSHLWLLWGFSANGHAAASPLVRPPVLGGNEKRGVFATRSPFRPNPVGLSSVQIERVEWDTTEGPVLHVLGADLMDGTPVFDIKPYLPHTDCHPDALAGFAAPHVADALEVVVPPALVAHFAPAEWVTLRRVLACDPRPRYIDDPERIYGMPFMGRDVRFQVQGRRLTVVQIKD